MWVVVRAPHDADTDLAVFPLLLDAQAASASTPGAVVYHAEGARTVTEAQAMVRSGAAVVLPPSRARRSDDAF
jgi:hypothetical protein